MFETILHRSSLLRFAEDNYVPSGVLDYIKDFPMESFFDAARLTEGIMSTVFRRTGGYCGWKLSEASHAEVLEKFPPSFPDVYAHHITLSPNWGFVPRPVKVSVVGVASGEGVEALLVTVDGAVLKKDGTLFHVTLSVNKAAGMRPHHSKGLSLGAYREVEPVELEVIPFYVEDLEEIFTMGEINIDPSGSIT